MKRILGGIVCLVLPALALAQDGGTAGGIEFLLAEENVNLLRPAPDSARLPVAASRVLDADGNLLLVGGVEERPTETRPYRQWNPELEVWGTTGATLPDVYDPDVVVAAAWIEQPNPGLLTFGLSTPGADTVAAAHLNGQVLRISTTNGCVDPMPTGIDATLGAPIFAAKPADAFGNKDTLLLYVQEIDPNQPAAWGRLYGVSVIPGPALCLLPVLDRATLPLDHVLGSLVFDPEPRGGTGALVFAGGFDTALGNNYTPSTTPTLVFADGSSRKMSGWLAGQAAMDLLPSPVGGLLLFEARPTDPGLGNTPTFRDARWNETDDRYDLSRRVTHAVEDTPPRAGVAPEIDGMISRVAYLPGAAGILLNEILHPVSIGIAGERLRPEEPPGSGWAGIFYGDTLRVHASVEEIELWPDADPEEVLFQVTLGDEVTSQWAIHYPNRDESGLGLDLGGADQEVPGDGIIREYLRASESGETTLILELQDLMKIPALQALLPVTVRERESLYTGFGCSSGAEGSVLLAGLALLGLGLLLRRRRGRATALILAALLMAAPALAEEAEDKRPKLAFLGVTPGAGVDEPTAEAISDYIQTLTASTRGYRLIRLTEVKQMLGFEAQRQLLGCDDDGSCMADIAGALEVDRLLRASVSRLGESMVVQLTLLDGVKATQLGASGMRLEKTQNAEAVLDVLPEILNEIFATDPRFVGKKVKHRSRNVRSHTRERRWSFGAGADIDLTHGGNLLLGAHIGYRSRILGFGLGLLPRMGKTPIDGSPVPVAMRGELRLRLFRAGPVHPHLAAGVTYFPKDVPLPRIALHVEIDFHRYLRGFVSIAGEAVIGEQPFDRSYLLLNIGAAFTP